MLFYLPWIVIFANTVLGLVSFWVYGSKSRSETIKTVIFIKFFMVFLELHKSFPKVWWSSSMKASWFPPSFFLNALEVIRSIQLFRMFRFWVNCNHYSDYLGHSGITSQNLQTGANEAIVLIHII